MSLTTRGARRSLRDRAVVTAIGALLVGQSFAAPAAAAEPRDDGKDTYVEAPNARPADYVPIDVPSSELGSTPLPSDPSIGTTAPYVRDAPPGEKAELPDVRTEYTRTFANPDGTYSTEASGRRINYLESNGRWTPIDLSLVGDDVAGFDLRAQANDRVVRLGTTDAKSHLARLSYSGTTIALRAVSYDAAKPLQGDGKVRFDAPLSGQLEVHPTEEGLGYTITLDRLGLNLVYHLVLDTGNLEARIGPDGRTIELASTAPPDGSSRVAGVISAPQLIDGAFEPAPAEAVTVALLGRDAKDIPLDVPAGVLEGLGETEVLLSYRIDPAWARDFTRIYPIVLDPNVCLGAGASGCTINGTTGNVDHFYMSGLSNEVPSGWTVLRMGYDDRVESPSKNYGAMRTLFFFPDVVLDDGAVPFNATLGLTINSHYGSVTGDTVEIAPMERKWDTSPTNGDWDWVNGGSGAVTNSTSVPASNGAWSIGVHQTVIPWYARNWGKAWKANVGFMMRLNPDTTGSGEITIDRSTHGTAANRPKLTIDYTIPSNDIDFPPELGTYYSPSTMLAASTTKLPVSIRNDNSGITIDKCTSGSDTDCYMAGYRWFDKDGDMVGNGFVDLPASIATNTASAVFSLTLTVPSTVANYSLRLDVVHRLGAPSSRYYYASDFAMPSKFHSRDKKFNSPESVRFTGTSAIERADFSVNVVAAGGANSGEVKTVTLGDGSMININLWSRNLRLVANTGLGFADFMSPTVTYGYDRARRSEDPAATVLGANGWWTNYDERFIPQPDTGEYVYQDAGGSRHTASLSGFELSSDIGGQVERPRITVLDDNWLGNHGALVTSPKLTGDYSTRSSLASWSPGSLVQPIDLNTYRLASFALRTDTAAGFAIDFQVRNLTDTSVPDTWIAYTVGTDFATPCCVKVHLPNANTGSASGTLIGGWYEVKEQDLLADAVAQNLGELTDQFEVIAFQFTTNGTGGYTYADAVRFQPLLDMTFLEPSSTPAADWTADPTDAAGVASTYYHKERTVCVNGPCPSSTSVTPTTWTDSPLCDTSDGCLPAAGDLTQSPYVSWYWQKVGGGSIAASFKVHDARTVGPAPPADGWLTYYAGPTPPAGAPNPIQVSSTAPTAWSRVTRDLSADARQVLGYYYNSPLSTTALAGPPGAPGADPVTLLGYRLGAVGGGYGLFDWFSYGSAGQTIDDYEDPTSPDYLQPPDFLITTADGTVRKFNQDGLLTAIENKDGHAITLGYDRNPLVAGQSSYTLEGIYAPSHEPPTGGSDVIRWISVSETSGSATRAITFTENLGLDTAGVTGRSAEFTVANQTGSANPGGVWGVNDLIYASPARDTNHGDRAHPSGMAEYYYRDNSGHTLEWISDPRWIGGGGQSGERWQIDYLGTLDPSDSETGTDPTDVIEVGTSTRHLRIFSWDRGTSYAARPLYQDLNGTATERAIHLDLSPDGQMVTEYIPQLCTSSNCTAAGGVNLPVASGTNFVDLKRIRFYRNGAGHVDSTVNYRTTGVGQGNLVSISRIGTNAVARVDSFGNPLAGTEADWSQSADQYYASMEDSAGTNPDLYRTRKSRTTACTARSARRPSSPTAPLTTPASSLREHRTHSPPTA